MEARYLTDLEWRICHAVNIYVFKNGRDGEQPVLVHVPPSKKKNMRTLLNVVQERVKYPVGYAKYLYKMDGTRVKDPCELEMYNNYVVASNFEKHFKCAAYGRKRSPLLVLNRESKHVRVLKLQNHNYYEWLLKKKAVGEERPPYIYPTFYTNDNHKPQDIPVGQMGNYHPPEVKAPGCCYPKWAEEGNKTYRTNSNQQYVVNTVTVDVTPDLGNTVKLPGQDRQLKPSNKPNRHGKLGGKTIYEPTPSDMLNANVISDGTSREGLSVGSSETEVLNKPRKSKGNPKSHRARSVTPGGSHLKQGEETRSSEDNRRHHHKKSSRRSKRKRDDHEFLAGIGGLPPPPSQFRDNVECANNLQPPLLHQEKHEVLNYVDQNGNVFQIPSQNTFYYSPEKLAAINPNGNVHAYEIPNMNQQQLHSPGRGQWAILHQPQQQIFAIDPQQAAPPPAFFPVGQPIDSSSPNAFYPGVLGAYPPVQNFPVQSHPIPATIQQVQGPPQGIPMLLSTPQGPPQCVVIPNPDPGRNPVPTAQFVALQSPTSQNHLQQVYQLGIVQQPNPQTCIQVDAKAMRQYVDNQKIIESRFGNGTANKTTKAQPHSGGHRNVRPSKETELSSEQTESEVDIPFTPLKTYRLHPTISSPSHGKVSSKRHATGMLPKVKSRNVAIQMGYPGTSAVSGTEFYASAPSSDFSFKRDQIKNSLKSCRDQLLSSRDSARKGLDMSFLLSNANSLRSSDKPNFCSDQFVINSGRAPFVHKSNNSTNSRTARDDEFSSSSGPGMDDLVAIPPPTEFRENVRYPVRHPAKQFASFNDNPSQPTNNRIDKNRVTMQYIYGNFANN